MFINLTKNKNVTRIVAQRAPTMEFKRNVSELHFYGGLCAVSALYIAGMYKLYNYMSEEQNPIKDDSTGVAFKNTVETLQNKKL